MLFNIFLFSSFILSFEEIYECEVKDYCDDITGNAVIKSTSKGRYCGCSGTAVDITVQCSTIFSYSFYKNSKIKKIKLDGVSAINEGAFYGCGNLIEVDFSSSLNLNSINGHAFQHSAIATLNGINSLTNLITIGPFSFCSIKATSTIKLPDNVQTIDNNAFQNSGATFSFKDLPSKLTNIGDYAFENTKFTDNFDEFKLASLEIIGCYAFNLKDIKNNIGHLNLPGTCTFKENAFGVATFSHITINGGIVGEKSFEKATIQDSITITGATIKEDAFSIASFTNNKATFTIIDSTIEESAFRGFSFNGGGTLTIRDCEIGSNSFERILGKPNVVFERDEQTNEYDIGKEAFYNSQIVGPLEIPDFISKVGKNAFAHCQYLDKDLILNASTIDDYSFAYCAFNGKLTLGSNIETFTKTYGRFHGFEGCEFNSLTLEPELKISIPAGMFYQLKTIEGEVKFSEHVSGIEDEAFSGCTGITSIVFDRSPQNPLSIGKSAFFGCSGIGGDIEIDRLVYYDEDLAIAEKAFYGCSNIHSIDLPNEITTISSGAFYGCYGLETINMPKSLTLIEKNAFYRCSSLNIDLVIPNLVQTIQEYAFYECTSLKSIVVGYSVTTIGKYAFCRCKFTGDLVIPSVTGIQEGAFLGCEALDGKLELYTGPSSATIGQSAFEGCSSLQGPLNINSFNQIDKRAFRGCSSLTGELNFNSGLSKINDYIFDGCGSLTGPITFPSSISPATIGEYAFNGCSGLSGDLKLPSNTEEIKQHAFHGCSGLTGPIVLTTTLNQIRRFAFAGCTGLSDSITVTVDGSNTNDPTIIERGAFEGCKGFKNGKLSFFIVGDEEMTINTNDKISKYYRYGYFLRIENQAFEDCKFKNVYYNGRFQPDCDYDIGLSKTKGIKTSSNYANKTFCSYPLHSNKLSGGAIAGIVIACIVVVAVIAVLVVFLILKKKKSNKNNESEVEMNNEP